MNGPVGERQSANYFQLLIATCLLTLLILTFLRPGSWATNLEGRTLLRDCLAGSMTPPESFAHAWFRGVAADCAGETAVARSAWRAALSESPRYVSLLRASLPADVELATVAAAKHPTHAEAHFWLGAALAAEGDDAGAIAAYERGLALDGDDGLTWVRLGRIYEARGDWETAVQAYDQGCRLVDKGKNGCPSAGRLYLTHERYELAAERFRSALAQLPGWPPARRGLAEALLGLGQIEEARPHLEALATAGDSWAGQQLERLAGER